MNRRSRPGRYANVTATLALVLALGSATYAAVAPSGGGSDSRADAIASSLCGERAATFAGAIAAARAGRPAATMIKAKIVNAANVADAAIPPDTTLASFTTDFPSVPAHECIFRLVTFEPSDWYLMPVWIDNYLPPGLVVTNLQGQSYGASLNVCNVTDGALDPPSRTYNLLLVDRFTARR
jgi:hypothetical protein